VKEVSHHSPCHRKTIHRPRNFSSIIDFTRERALLPWCQLSNSGTYHRICNRISDTSTQRADTEINLPFLPPNQQPQSIEGEL